MKKPPVPDLCPACLGTGLRINQAEQGARMRALRHEADLSLYDMAPRLKLSVGFLCNLERGKRRWTRRLVEGYRKATQGKA